MKGQKKVIALCVPNVNDEYVSETIGAIYNEAAANGHKLITFVAGIKYYDKNISSDNALDIFNNVNMDIIDVLMILTNRFSDDRMVGDLIDRAFEAKVPVVAVNGVREGCYSVIDNGSSALETIIREVIIGNKRKKPYFMAGIPGEATNDARFAIFEKICNEAGIEVTNDMIGRGEYWEKPTEAVMEKLLADKNIPDAIICANDIMAIESARILTENGYRVPEDVMITGYDGIQMSRFNNPSITTSAKNYRAVAAGCMKILDEIAEGKTEPHNIYVEHSVEYGASTGHVSDLSVDKSEKAALYREIHEIRRHENEIYNWITNAIVETDINRLKRKIAGHILRGSYVSLNSYAFSEIVDPDETEGLSVDADKMVIFAANVDGEQEIADQIYEVSEMIPDFETWLEDDTMCFVSGLFAEEFTMGNYIHCTDSPIKDVHMLNRLTVMLNLIFGNLYRKVNQMQMARTMEDAKYLNPISKVPNMKGFTSWFNGFSSISENHRRAISLSIYNVKRYKYIFENYGMDDIEDIISYVAKAFVKSVRPENTYIAHITEDDFAIFNYSNVDSADKEQDVQDMITETTNTFYGLIGDFNAANGKPYALEINAGATWSAGGWNENLNTYIRMANGNLYLNRLKYGSDAVVVQKTTAKDANDEAKQLELELKFDLLLEKNLFNYFFQPLVDAHTGEIYAYEALMRTTKEVGLFPNDILDIATKKNKLYSIEYATFFNVFERFQQDYMLFKGRKVFINTIPGCFLSDDDLNALTEKYGKYMSHCVIELTEGESLADNEIQIMKGLTDHPLECQLAVDDYGTGHSNIVNVLRYDPHIIKIDRFLITDIQNDTNKQMFVKNAIEFARANDIKVVAEGVETLEELQTVIKLGADLIQGYYTAKPAPEPLDELPAEIKQQIVEAYGQSLD